jgi:hypothetical protein
MNRRGEVRQRIRAQRMYRLLVRLYPAAHRQAFGQQMVQTFGDHYRDAVQCRGGSRLRFWFAVLADAATSVVTEHAAEVRTHRRRAAGTRPLRRDGVTGNGRRRARRGSVRAMRDMAVEQRGGLRRRTRVRRRLRYRRSACRRARVLIRTRHHQLLYRGRLSALALMLVVLAAVGLAVGTATAHLRISALVTGLLVAVWLGYRLRLTRPVPAGPHGDGPTPPGGAGVREPRRPLPMSPAGAAARPRLDHEPPGQATAVI